jgi:hypothetical protein
VRRGEQRARDDESLDDGHLDILRTKAVIGPNRPPRPYREGSAIRFASRAPIDPCSRDAHW